MRANNKRSEYDFSGGVRGKFAKRFKNGTNMIVLSPDVSKVFPDSESVNSALRDLMDIVLRGGKSKNGKKRAYNKAGFDAHFVCTNWLNIGQ